MYTITKAFLMKLQTLIYGFLWGNKGLVSPFKQPCLSLLQGVLGLIHAQKQHLVLQIRHLRHFFSSGNRSSMVLPLCIHHISVIANSISTLLFSLYTPDVCKHELNHSTSIMHAVYKIFDHFHLQADISNMLLQNLLLLPLHYLI
jgi:hypothetical protein